MTPPEVVLDRWLKTRARERPGCRGYVGKLDLDKVDPPSFASFLSFVQVAMNQPLEAENANASGGTAHPPFHFDYVDVEDGSRNAHAFQHAGFSFIVVTLPPVEMLWEVSHQLARSPLVLQLLGIRSSAIRLEALQALLFQFQLTVLVSHEYTHHVHRHSGAPDRAWDEFGQGGLGGRLEDQAQELDADGYGLYLTLANYVRGPARQNALAQVGKQSLNSIQGDEFLLTAFFVAVAALFCSLWPDKVSIHSIRKLAHPPAPIRIDYAIRCAAMWCGQNKSLPESWFGAERFQAIYLAATNGIGGTRPQWDAHVAFLKARKGQNTSDSCPSNSRRYERGEAAWRNSGRQAEA